jgi:hypothetical protein
MQEATVALQKVTAVPVTLSKHGYKTYSPVFVMLKFGFYFR